jgi:glycosyltransferase involved in cell wall biosynthesis
MTPLVTAVIPCFNYGRFVAGGIDSVFAQTYPNIECVVVDDGSTDETANVLRGFGERIRVIHQPHRGVSAARNAAIAVSRGDFIALLDGDDKWQPGKIEAQLAHLTKHPHIGCVGCGLEHIYADGTIEPLPGRRNHADRRTTYRNLALRRFWIGGSGSGAFIRRSVLRLVGPFDEQLVAAEDWDMWLRIAAEADIDNVEPMLVSINRHGTGVFRNARLMEENQWKVYRKIVENDVLPLTAVDRRRLRALILADAARESPVRADALAFYVRSLKQWPCNYRRTRAAAVLAVRALQALLQSSRATNHV